MAATRRYETYETDLREGIAVCGTVRGYLAHQHRNQPPCGFCRRAWAAWKPEHRPKKRARTLTCYAPEWTKP